MLALWQDRLGGVAVISMSEKYYGEARVRAQGGSLAITIPADAVRDLDISEGDHLPVYGTEGLLSLVSFTERGDDNDVVS